MAVSQGAFLVVDDDPRVTRSLVRVMRSVRPCVSAYKFEEADRFLRDEGVWCGFLFDLVLGVHSGLELLELARMRHPRVPALIMSGHLLHGQAATNRAYALGSAFVSKPIGALELQRFYSDAIAYDAGLDHALSGAVGAFAHLHRLTSAETEVLALAMLREPAARIFERRGVSENTHKTQVRSLLKKLNAPTLDEACRRVLTRDDAGATGAEKPRDA